MKATGVVRRVDDLGRLVIPREIRRTLHIREADPIEIFTGPDQEIILKKYSPVGEMSDTARQLSDVLSQTSGLTACICDQDHILCAAGKYAKELQDQEITPELHRLLLLRKTFRASNTDREYICPAASVSEKHFSEELLCPVLSGGDPTGAVLLLAPDSARLEASDIKLASAAALLLSRQLS